MTAAVLDPPRRGPRRRRLQPRRVALYLFLSFMAVTWLFPLLWAAYTAFRPYADTVKNGYISWPTGLNLDNITKSLGEGHLPAVALNLDNFVNAFTQGRFPTFYLNSLIIAVPSVIIVLLVSSMVAFAVSRFRWRFNLVFLMIFTAGNLLPQQVIIVPLYELYISLPLPAALSDNGKLLYDQYQGTILINIVFQLGFCIFVLSNYMKTLSHELTEAALADGASVFRIYWNVILPLCRPALAALATLEFTFIYNDFFWALLLMKTGDKRPITSALNNLQGQFFTDTNLLAAGALLAAIPTILLYLALQRHFISGLTLGSSKG